MGEEVEVGVEGDEAGEEEREGGGGRGDEEVGVNLLELARSGASPEEGVDGVGMGRERGGEAWG